MAPSLPPELADTAAAAADREASALLLAAQTVAAALSAAAERALAERSAGERPLPPLTAPSLPPELADTAAAAAD
eukprot:3547891-Prymnesium_polylepis.1